MKILILSSSTGGGHNMRARAISAWAKQNPQQPLSTEIHQTLEATHPLYRFGVNLYNWIQWNAPFLHHVYFNFLEVAGLFTNPGQILNKQNFQKILKELQPDIIVSVHGSLNHGFFEIARSTLKPKKVRCITYCGELSGSYGFSRHWVNPSSDLFIGATTKTCETAVRLKMPPQKTMVGGFLLDPSFYNTPLNEQTRREYIQREFNFDPDKFILLLSCSATGANNHFSFLKALNRSGLKMQVIALCGHSSSTLEKISHWAKQEASFPIRAIPYTSQMAILMKAVSAIVARPGTGTTSEAIVSECPILFNGLGGIMPQEKITLDFCRAYGFDNVLRCPDDLPRFISQFLSKSEKPSELQSKMRQSRPQGHPLEILQSITKEGS